MRSDATTPAMRIGTVAGLIEPFKSGSCAVTIRFQNDAANGEIELGEAWRVNLDDRLLGNLRESLSAENVQVVY